METLIRCFMGKKRGRSKETLKEVRREEHFLAFELHENAHSSAEDRAIVEESSTEVGSVSTSEEPSEVHTKRFQITTDEEKECERLNEYLDNLSGTLAISGVNTHVDIPGTSLSSTNNHCEGDAKSDNPDEKQQETVNDLLLNVIDVSETEPICGRCEKQIVKTELKDLVKAIFHDSKLYSKTRCPLRYHCEICKYHPVSKFELESHFLCHAYANEAYCLKCREEISNLSTEPNIDEQTAELRMSFASSAKKGEMDADSKVASCEPPRCGRCGVIFDYIVSALYKHLRMLSQSPASEPVYICTICQFQNHRLLDMKLHIIDDVTTGKALCKQCKEISEK